MTKQAKSRLSRRPKPLVDTLAKKATMSTQHLCAAWIIFDTEKEAEQFVEAVDAARKRG